MKLEDELIVEYKRLVRNADDLSDGWREHVARDLVASLRNWVQLSQEIDRYIEVSGYELRFPVHDKTKAEKRTFRDGSEGFYIPAAVSTGPVKVAHARYHAYALSPEEIRQIAQAGPRGTSVKNMSFEAWLNTSVYEIKVNGERTSISRRQFINRCANMLGGTHPASSYIPDRNEQMFDEQILQLLNTTVADIPAPWTLVVEAANGAISAFKDLSIKDFKL